MKKAGLKGILIILMAIGVTLFLNFDIYSITPQLGGITQLKLSQDKESSQDKQIDKYIKEGKTKFLKEEKLFLVEKDPYVPGFILQGNYVISGSSPEGGYRAFLYPDEWETIADIYLKDLKEGKWRRLVFVQDVWAKIMESNSPDAKYTPKKKIHWLNEEEFITIVGYAHGTISKGGDVVKVKGVTGEGEIIYQASTDPFQEVVDFLVDGEDLVLKIHILDVNGFCLKKDTVRLSLKERIL